MLFIKKGNNYLPPNNFNFKDFIENKIDLINKEGPKTEDLELHLSTIFTELRLKKYLEIRSIDAYEWDCHCATRFLHGITYGNLNEALEVVKNWKNDILNAYTESPKKGLATELNGKNMLNGLKF